MARTGGDGMAEWWSIEVFSGDRLPASGWRYAYEDDLTEAAITHGAMYYEWHDTEYGVIFEVLFRDDEQWDAFRALPAVRAALDGVPDPVDGLIIYRGRGGTSGSRRPRKPKPAPSAAALELDEPEQERKVRVPRKLLYNRKDAIDEVIRELGGDPARIDEPDRSPGTDVPGAGTPEADPVSRDIAAVDRSGE